MSAEANWTEQATKLDRFIGLLKNDSGNASLRHRCVELAVAIRKFDLVVDLANAGLAQNPADDAARFELATGLIGQGHYREALKVLEKLAVTSQDAVGVRSNIALCRYCLGDFEQALPHLEFCYTANERSSGLVRLLVSSYHHLGRVDEAIVVAEANAAAAGSDSALAGVYALLFLDADDAAKAMRWAKTALDLDPKSVDGRVTRATLLTARMQLDEARSLFNDVVADAPNAGRAWIGLGTLALLERDLAAARQHMMRGLELMPMHIGSWHVLAWTNLLSNDLDGADRAFQTALAGDRNFSESHGGLAVIAAMRGDRAVAQERLRTALRLDAGCLSAKFAQALLEGSDDPARAREIIRAAAADLGAKDGSALAQLLSRVSKH